MYVSSAPYVGILIDSWRSTLRAEVEHVVTKGWTKDLVPDHVRSQSAATSRDELDENWVKNLMVEYHWNDDLYRLMNHYATADPKLHES